MRQLSRRDVNHRARRVPGPKITRPKVPERWSRIVVIIALVGTYTNFAAGAGTLIFGILTFLAGGLLMVVHLKQARRHANLLVMLVAICGIIDVGSTAFPEMWFELALSTALLIACIIAGLGLFFELRTWPRAMLCRWCAIASVVVLGLGILEYLAPFRELSDAARQFLYSDDQQFLYAGDERDVTLHGVVRPKVFTQEPSHPAKFVAVVVTGWFLLSHRKNKATIALVGCILGYMILRSPSIMIGPAMILYFSFFGQSRVTGERSVGKLSALVFALVAMVTFTDWIGIVPGTRAQAIASNADGSMVMRLLAPIAIAQGAIAANPLFGLGIGGKEAAVDMVFSIYAGFSQLDADWQFQQNDVFGWGSGLFQFVSFCGILGSALFIAWLIRLCKRVLSPDWTSVLVIIVLTMAVDGGFNMMRPWAYAFFLVATLHVAYRDRILRGASTATFPASRMTSFDPRIEGHQPQTRNF